MLTNLAWLRCFASSSAHTNLGIRSTFITFIRIFNIILFTVMPQINKILRVTKIIKNKEKISGVEGESEHREKL